MTIKYQFIDKKGTILKDQPKPKRVIIKALCYKKCEMLNDIGCLCRLFPLMISGGDSVCNSIYKMVQQEIK